MDYILHGLNCGIFIILAVGLNLINGICGQLNLGHAGFGRLVPTVLQLLEFMPLQFLTLLIFSFLASLASFLLYQVLL